MRCKPSAPTTAKQEFPPDLCRRRQKLIDADDMFAATLRNLVNTPHKLADLRRGIAISEPTRPRCGLAWKGALWVRLAEA